LGFNKRTYVSLHAFEQLHESVQSEQKRLMQTQNSIQFSQKLLDESQRKLGKEQERLNLELQSSRAKVEKQGDALRGQRRDLVSYSERLSAQGNKLELGLTAVNRLRKDLQEDFRLQMAAMAKKKPESRLLELQDQILSPVFQLSGGEAVGSAVLFHKKVSGEHTQYYALSCYHVIRDILENRSDLKDFSAVWIEATFTYPDGKESHATARMVAWDVPTDLALLELRSESPLTRIAELAPENREKDLGVFSKIYTVGCPLGTAAQATKGEITRHGWEVDGEDYWMVSSPAYFGNSGGGVFHAETLELVGIFAKIYTHGTYRPQVITHMGLAIPISTIHAWLRAAGYEDLLRPSLPVQIENAAG